MDHAVPFDENALIAGETAVPPAAPADDLAWAVIKMQASERIVINEALIAAHYASFGAHHPRAEIGPQGVRPVVSAHEAYRAASNAGNGR